jgi:hypothetical protein
MNIKFSPLNNPFSVLRLSADSSSVDITTTYSKLLIRIKLANDQQPMEQIDCIQTAKDSLSDPLIRFNAGCYWISFTSSCASDSRTM